MSHRYLVIQLRPIEDGTPDEPSAWYEPTPVLCEDTRAVHAAIRQVQGEPDADWHVFEWVNKKYERRAVTFVRDGEVSYDVQIS